MSSYRIAGSCHSYQIVVSPASFVLSELRMVETSRREMGLGPLEISRRLEEPGMCFWMILWHSIYRCCGGAVELIATACVWAAYGLFALWPTT
jgi:hypothetical protein